MIVEVNEKTLAGFIECALLYTRLWLNSKTTHNFCETLDIVCSSSENQTKSALPQQRETKKNDSFQSSMTRWEGDKKGIQQNKVTEPPTLLKENKLPYITTVIVARPLVSVETFALFWAIIRFYFYGYFYFHRNFRKTKHKSKS